MDASGEVSMYSPLVMAFNYALEELPRLDVPGLPAFEESRQIVFLRNDPRYIVAETYLQGSYKPDIVLVKWEFFKNRRENKDLSYSLSHESGALCGDTDSATNRLGWRNLLSTLEVKLGSRKATGDGGKVSRARVNFTEYTGNFGDLRGDCQAVESSKSSEFSESSPLGMVCEAQSVVPSAFSCCLSLLLFSFRFSYSNGDGGQPELGSTCASHYDAKEA